MSETKQDGYVIKAKALGEEEMWLGPFETRGGAEEALIEKIGVFDKAEIVYVSRDDEGGEPPTLLAACEGLLELIRRIDARMPADFDDTWLRAPEVKEAEAAIVGATGKE